MTNPTIISTSALSAAHEIASAIAGHGDTFAVRRGETQTREIRAGQPYTELQLLNGSEWASSTITIRKPDEFTKAEVSWGSSSSRMANSVEYALATADLLNLSAAVVLLLNQWAADGSLEVAS